MTAATFPRIVADIDGSGWPFFALKPGIPGEPVVWRATPTLPDGCVWADELDRIGHTYTVLDQDAIVELLYSSALLPADHPTRERVAEVVEARLYAFRCQVAANPSHDERHRLAECRAWAAQLTGVSS